MSQQQNLGVTTITVKNGVPLNFSQEGNNFKVLKTSPMALIVAVTDDGQQTKLVPGMDIERNFKRITITCPGAGADVQAQVYCGFQPLKKNPTVEPANTFCTVDWITVHNNDSVTMKGTLLVAGNTYRRSKIILANVTGIAGMNPAVLGILETQNTARSSFSGGFDFNGPQYPLFPATATQIFPVTVETDDILILSPFALAGPVDVNMIITWAPAIAI